MTERKAPPRTVVPKAPTVPCPDNPNDFFIPVKKWSDQFQKWATEVDSCYDTTCGTPARRSEFMKVCKKFSKFAQHAQTWAEDVENCFQTKCSGPPGHTKPPPPPF